MKRFTLQCDRCKREYSVALSASFVEILGQLVNLSIKKGRGDSTKKVDQEIRETIEKLHEEKAKGGAKQLTREVATPGIVDLVRHSAKKALGRYRKHQEEFQLGEVQLEVLHTCHLCGADPRMLNSLGQCSVCAGICDSLGV